MYLSRIRSAAREDILVISLQQHEFKDKFNSVSFYIMEPSVALHEYPDYLLRFGAF